MTEQVQEEGITLGQIFKAMFFNKIRFLIVSVATFVVLLLGILVIYNPGKETYVAKFKYSDINIANGHYSNGKTFNALDLIDLMEEVKQTNQKYSNIDVDKIIAKNGVTITEDFTVKKIETTDKTDTEEFITSHYTLTCNAKLFPDYKTAKSFMTDLISYPVAKSNYLANSIVFDENLKLYDVAKIYANQIDYLNAQKKYLIDGYNALINSYGDVSYNNVKLSSKVKEISLYFENNKLDLLSDEITKNGYVKDLITYKSNLETQKYNLTLESEYNAKKLDQLAKQRDDLIAKASKDSSIQTLDLSTYNDSIISLTQRNIDIAKEVEILDKYLDSSSATKADGSVNENYYSDAKRAVFESKLNQFRVQLENYTNDYKECYLECIQDYNIYYNDAAKVVSDGGFSTAMTLVISVLVGFAVACVVNLIADRKILSKEYIEEEKKLKQINN